MGIRIGIVTEEDVDWVTGHMKGWFEMKVWGTLGPEEGDDKEIPISNGMVRVTEEGV